MISVIMHHQSWFTGTFNITKITQIFLTQHMFAVNVSLYVAQSDRFVITKITLPASKIFTVQIFIEKNLVKRDRANFSFLMVHLCLRCRCIVRACLLGQMVEQ